MAEDRVSPKSSNKISAECFHSASTRTLIFALAMIYAPFQSNINMVITDEKILFF